LTQTQFTVTIEPLESFLGVFRQANFSRMIKAVAQFNSRVQDVSLVHINASPRHQLAGATPVPLEDFIHELRQPLGVIDSLAYYLELTATDEKSSAHLERIRAMVAQANRILERASAAEPELAVSAASYLPGS
jgi:signal transduction histidine kinase